MTKKEQKVSILAVNLENPRGSITPCTTQQRGQERLQIRDQLWWQSDFSAMWWEVFSPYVFHSVFPLALWSPQLFSVLLVRIHLVSEVMVCDEIVSEAVTVLDWLMQHNPYYSTVSM